MKRRFMIAGVLVIACLGNAIQASALTVTTSSDADALVGALLGSGITLSPGTATYTGDALAAGTFTGGAASGIGINSGVILATGRASDAVGPNQNAVDADNGLDDTSTALGEPGDADLSALSGGFPTFDAAVLEFDFVSAGGDLYFNFVFASEEYNEWVDSVFNDVFAFYVDGVNIGLVPGTTDPVSINTVNGSMNSAYFNDNTVDSGLAPYDIEYDGFTDVFTASYMGLAAGTHSMVLAIADSSDAFLDSAVFLQAGSFDDEPTPPTNGVPDGGSTLILLSMAVLGSTAIRKRR